MNADDDEESAEDAAYWAAVENSPAFIASIARGRADIAAGRGVSHEETLRELEAREAGERPVR